MAIAPFARPVSTAAKTVRSTRQLNMSHGIIRRLQQTVAYPKRVLLARVAKTLVMCERLPSRRELAGQPRPRLIMMYATVAARVLAFAQAMRLRLLKPQRAIESSMLQTLKEGEIHFEDHAQ